MNHDKFLQIGGAILFLLGVVGIFGVIGPTADSSVFGVNWYFDMVENYVLILVGFISVISSALMSHAGQTNLSRGVGIISALLALYSLSGNNLFGVGLEMPADTIFYGVIGLWGIAASMKGKHSVA